MRKKLCYDFNLGDCVQIICPKSDWAGKIGIIDSIQHGIWRDSQTEYETEFLVKEIGGKERGRMMLYPGDFKKIDNIYSTLLKIKNITLTLKNLNHHELLSTRLFYIDEILKLLEDH